MTKVTSSSRHLTASMVVVDARVDKVLLVWHKATGTLMFPGGHIDQDESPIEAALREVYEETGLKAQPLGPALDLPGMTWQPSPWITAVIPAPAKPDRPGKPAEPAHSHIDLLFVGTADSQEPPKPMLSEVSYARWVPVTKLASLDTRAEVGLLSWGALNQVRDWR